MSSPTLAFLFFVVALVYAMAGFGGGSAYVALLALFDVTYTDIPPVSQVCNLIVVGGAAVHFFRKGFFIWRIFWPFAMGSLPMSLLGGMLHVSKRVFFFFLGLCLLATGIRIFFRDYLARIDTLQEKDCPALPSWQCGAAIGACLGLISGILGIGGGVLLAPILLYMRWGSPREITAISSVFILLNSASGLLGQGIKHGDLLYLTPYAPLFMAVFIGGQIGSCMSIYGLSEKWVQRVTTTLILGVGIQLLVRALAFI